jgi:tetrahydromethanopterin S-methyltransferase subunit G
MQQPLSCTEIDRSISSVFSEGNKLHECESKLHKTERQVEQLTAEVLQCKVKIQELEEIGQYSFF